MGVIIVGFISLNEDKTIEKAKNFLEEDFRDLINYSGMPLSDLSSPALDPAGVHGSNVNHADNNFIRNFEHMDTIEKCGYAVRATIEAINSCADTEREPYKSILFERYVKNSYDSWVYKKLNISKSTYDRSKRKAIIEFTKKLPRYRKKYHVESLVPSLLTYNVPA